VFLLGQVGHQRPGGQHQRRDGAGVLQREAGDFGRVDNARLYQVAELLGLGVEQDLPELLSFFSFPKHLWRKLRTANVIERCFVEVRRRARPMVCFVNVNSVDRIVFSIFNRFNEQWRNRTLRLFTQAA
jgi:transposase-like protein